MSKISAATGVVVPPDLKLPLALLTAPLSSYLSSPGPGSARLPPYRDRCAVGREGSAGVAVVYLGSVRLYAAGNGKRPGIAEEKGRSQRDQTLCAPPLPGPQ